jgi:hypothetical protein
MGFYCLLENTVFEVFIVMRFIRNSDYLFKITESDFNTLTDENNLFVQDAELKSQAEIELYLRKRYDLAQLFKSYPDYISGTTYTTGITVWYGTGFTEHLYSPLSATTSLPGSIHWVKVEPRNPLILDWMTTISLYKLHQRMSPDFVPSQRKDGYDMAMNQLKMIQQEKLTCDFPTIENRSYTIKITGATSQDSNRFLW